MSVIATILLVSMCWTISRFSAARHKWGSAFDKNYFKNPIVDGGIAIIWLSAWAASLFEFNATTLQGTTSIDFFFAMILTFSIIIILTQFFEYVRRYIWILIE